MSGVPTPTTRSGRPRPPVEESSDHPEPSLAGRIVSLIMFLIVPPVALATLAIGLGYVRLMHGPFTVAFGGASGQDALEGAEAPAQLRGQEAL